MGEKSCEKLQEKFSCEKCHYMTSRKSSYDKHLLTRKHSDRTIFKNLEQDSCVSLFACKHCQKTYKARNSLWYHEKKCPDLEN